jgi:hypothetical protein
MLTSVLGKGVSVSSNAGIVTIYCGQGNEYLTTTDPTVNPLVLAKPWFGRQRLAVEVSTMKKEKGEFIRKDAVAWLCNRLKAKIKKMNHVQSCTAIENRSSVQSVVFRDDEPTVVDADGMRIEIGKENVRIGVGECVIPFGLKENDSLLLRLLSVIESGEFIGLFDSSRQVCAGFPALLSSDQKMIKPCDEMQKNAFTGTEANPVSVGGVGEDERGSVCSKADIAYGTLLTSLEGMKNPITPARNRWWFLRKVLLNANNNDKSIIFGNKCAIIVPAQDGKSRIRAFMNGICRRESLEQHPHPSTGRWWSYTCARHKGIELHELVENNESPPKKYDGLCKNADNVIDAFSKKVKP